MVLEYSSLSKRYWVTVTNDPTIKSREFFVRYLTDWMEIELLPDERDISDEGSSNSCFVDEIRTDEEFFCANFLSTNKFCPNKVTIKIRS